MTGFDSKRQAAQAKVNDDDDAATLLIVYQRGFADGKAAQPEQEPTCPECKAVVLYECVACSSNNYPPKPEQEPVAFINPPGPITQYTIPTQSLPDEIVRLAGVALHEMPRPRTDWHSCAKLVCEAVVAHNIKEKP
jgi:hypothetical protein